MNYFLVLEIIRMKIEQGFKLKEDLRFNVLAYISNFEVLRRKSTAHLIFVQRFLLLIKLQTLSESVHPGFRVLGFRF